MQIVKDRCKECRGDGLRQRIGCKRYLWGALKCTHCKGCGIEPKEELWSPTEIEPYETENIAQSPDKPINYFPARWEQRYPKYVVSEGDFNIHVGVEPVEEITIKKTSALGPSTMFPETVSVPGLKNGDKE